MTEVDWLTSTDPTAMLRAISTPSSARGNPPRVSDRKLRLFACACVRLFWQELTEGMREVVRVAELMADGLAGDEDFYSASSKEHESEDRSGDSKLRVLIHKCAMNLSWDGVFVASGSIDYALYLKPALKAEIADQLRSVVGNPFRPAGIALVGPEWAKLGPKWRTPYELAQAAYEERPGRVCERCKGKGDWIEEHLNLSRAVVVGHSRIGCSACHGAGRVEDGTLCPDRLAVLADALEDAGCEDETILRWLRGEERCGNCMGAGWVECDTGGNIGRGHCIPCHDKGWRPRRTPSFRGDWCIDLLLGKD